MTVLFLLALLSFITAILSVTWPRCPLWVPVILLSLFALLQTVPLGR